TVQYTSMGDRDLAGSALRLVRCNGVDLRQQINIKKNHARQEALVQGALAVDKNQIERGGGGTRYSLYRAYAARMLCKTGGYRYINFILRIADRRKLLYLQPNSRRLWGCRMSAAE
ncbi:MAG: hypothetical protein K1V69_03360, partial [Alistipes sp.]